MFPYCLWQTSLYNAKSIFYKMLLNNNLRGLQTRNFFFTLYRKIDTYNSYSLKGCSCFNEKVILKKLKNEILQLNYWVTTLSFKIKGMARFRNIYNSFLYNICIEYHKTSATRPVPQKKKIKFRKIRNLNSTKSLWIISRFVKYYISP